MALSVYLNEAPPPSLRMRAATEALAFESPKLSATPVFANGEDFASMLERAIERSGKAGAVRQIELKAEPSEG